MWGVHSGLVSRIIRDLDSVLLYIGSKSERLIGVEQDSVQSIQYGKWIAQDD